MVGIYFSGTGNTRHCIEVFLKEYEASAIALSIEDAAAKEAIKQSDFIVFAYPIYFSNLPKIVRDFLWENKDIFAEKKVFIIATMGLFSGDGTGCSARIFTKMRAKVVGGLHLKMPDCIGDEKLLKKTVEQNKQLVREAEAKVKQAVAKLKSDNATQEGIGFLYHMAGLFGQRLWFYGKTKNYSDKLKIDTAKCVGCGNCVDLCPLKNIKIVNQKAQADGKCTMCYRCVSHCPQEAITLLGKELYEQARIEKYL